MFAAIKKVFLTVFPSSYSNQYQLGRDYVREECSEYMFMINSTSSFPSEVAAAAEAMLEKLEQFNEEINMARDFGDYDSFEKGMEDQLRDIRKSIRADRENYLLVKELLDELA